MSISRLPSLVKMVEGVGKWRLKKCRSDGNKICGEREERKKQQHHQESIHCVPNTGLYFTSIIETPPQTVWWQLTPLTDGATEHQKG